MRKRFVPILLLSGIVLLASFFRLYQVNWDQGFHMHPDERAIIMAVDKLTLPTSIASFFSPDSPLNPHFFAYGSFPFYLLRVLGNVFGMIDMRFATYDAINIVGRVTSAIFDLGTVVLLYFIGRKVAGSAVGLLASFFYAISVLPIQLSHFYAVDTPLTFFLTLTLFLLLRLYEHPSVRGAILIGVAFGLALATKISATVIIVSVGVTLTIDFLLLFLKKPHKPAHWFPHLPLFVKRLVTDAILIGTTAFLTFLVCEPYAFIDFSTFREQTYQQSLMTKDAFTFPYTLQYVGKIPYIYELKNIFFWGQGILLAIISFVGVVSATILLFQEPHKKKQMHLIILTFFWVYFAIIGNFAIGFMRYSLPLYPIMCLFGGLLIYRMHRMLYRSVPKPFLILCYTCFALYLLIWPVSFMQVYTLPSTRVQATEWITKAIPPGKSLALEHWDDALPLHGQERYTLLSLPMYEPDTPEKWLQISETLRNTDYIILASNRLSTPLQNLTNCEKLPPLRCYTQSAKYYKDLLAGKGGFKKVAEFTSFPTIPILNVPIDDQAADESFTVYDHPKIMIFEKHETN